MSHQPSKNTPLNPEERSRILSNFLGESEKGCVADQARVIVVTKENTGFNLLILSSLQRQPILEAHIDRFGIYEVSQSDSVKSDIDATIRALRVRESLGEERADFALGAINRLHPDINELSKELEPNTPAFQALGQSIKEICKLIASPDTALNMIMRRIFDPPRIIEATIQEKETIVRAFNDKQMPNLSSDWPANSVTFEAGPLAMVFKRLAATKSKPESLSLRIDSLDHADKNGLANFNLDAFSVQLVIDGNSFTGNYDGSEGVYVFQNLPTAGVPRVSISVR